MSVMDQARWRALIVVLPLASLLLLFGAVVMAFTPSTMLGETIGFVSLGIVCAVFSVLHIRHPEWLSLIAWTFTLLLSVALVIRLTLSFQHSYFQDDSNNAFPGVLPYIPLCYVISHAFLNTIQARIYSVVLWLVVSAVCLQFALPQAVTHSGRHGLFNMLLFVLVAQPMCIFLLSMMRAYVDQLLTELDQSSRLALEIIPEGRHQDPVTELYNRTHFESIAAHSLAAAIAEQRSIGIILIEVDQLKRYNDVNGYSAGDTLLRRIGKIIVAHAPVSAKFIARMRGGKFVVLCDLMSKAEVLATAERIRHGVIKAAYRGAESESELVSASVGICFKAADKDTALSDFLSDAERALSEAKRAGGNLVI